jgi:hypothetical protein
VVAFRITREIRASPEFVARWWLDYSADDPKLTAGQTHRSVQRIDANRVHLTTTTEFGGRLRTTDGTVTRTGPTSWQMTGHVISGGTVVSTLQSTYSIEPSSEGSCLYADFEFLGRTLAWKLALALSGYSLRRRQSRTFRDYIAAIESDFRASGPGPPVGTEKTAAGVDSEIPR